MLKRTNWGAVIAGAVTAISLQLLFSILGIAIGSTASDTTANSSTPQAISLAAGLWWLITGSISLFIGGCVVGRFSGMVRSPDTLLHAFVMWAVTAIFGFAVVSSGAGMALNDAVDAYTTQNLSRFQVGRFPMTANGRHSGEADRVIRTSDTSMQGGDQTATGSPADTTGNTVDKQDLEEARRVVRNASWWTLIALLVGIGVSLGGAWSTAPHRIVVRPTTAHD